MTRFRNKENDGAKAKNIAERLNAMADKVELDLANRFGVADAARIDGEGNSLDLNSISESVNIDREAYFETDSEKLAEMLDSSNSYGDSKSGGAEVFIFEEDGVFTATVDYDRDSEEFKSEDRDEVVQQAAAAAADYNADVMPSSYEEDMRLTDEAENAKSDEDALAFAEKMEKLAKDIDENRGDRQQAFELLDYAARIRDLIDKRKSQAPEQGLGQQADSNESTAAQAARADRAQDIAIDKLPAEASEEELEMEASDIEAKLAEIDSLAADNDRLGLRELELNSDYQDVRAEINEAKNKVDAQMDKADASKNAEIDDAIASGDISKLESLLRDPDYKGFDLVINDAIDELKASEEGLEQELPKA
jgi:ribosomal protein S15P/S13E